MYFELELHSGDGTKQVTLFPNSSQIITAADGQKVLEYNVVTAFVRSNKNLAVNIPLD